MASRLSRGQSQSAKGKGMHKAIWAFFSNRFGFVRADLHGLLEVVLEHERDAGDRRCAARRGEPDGVIRARNFSVAGGMCVLVRVAEDGGVCSGHGRAGDDDRLRQLRKHVPVAVEEEVRGKERCII